MPTRRTNPRRRLTRDDWATEALAALSEGGLAAVAVEPIAARLGTTKGSFYHHFSGREDLVAAALEVWENQHTTAVNAFVDATTAAPRERLRLLGVQAVRMAEHDPVGLTLLADAAHPLVAPVLQRVTQTRLDYLSRLFRAMGDPAPVASRRALLIYSVFLGHVQLAHSTPGAIPRSRTARYAYLDFVIDALDPGPTTPRLP